MALNLTPMEINELLALVEGRIIAVESEQTGVGNSNQALMQEEIDLLIELQMKLEAASAGAPGMNNNAAVAANVANVAAANAVANAVVANAAAEKAMGGARGRRSGRKTRKARKGRKGSRKGSRKARKGRKGSRRA
jgi:hypothetical protein